MNRSILTGLVAAVVVFFAGSSMAEKSEAKKCVCPVAGKVMTIQEAGGTAEYKDATVYFCCGGCKAKFEANQKKFAIKANKQLVATGQYKQVKCPIAGRPVSEEQSVEVSKVKVGFCCPGCKSKVAKAEGDKQLELVFDDKAFEKGFAIAKK